MGVCQSRMGVHSPLPALLFPHGDGVSSPPQYPWGSLPVSQLLPAISVAAMPLHCEDTCPGSLLVPLVNTGGEEGRDGSSWPH